MSSDVLIASRAPRGDKNTADDQERFGRLQRAIEHAAHLLPSQAPVQVFIHHNTLHAFEELPFHTAVAQGSAMFGCRAYLPEHHYREALEQGRILPPDLAAVLIDDLGDQADQLIGFLATRYHLRLAMLQRPLRVGTDDELRWLIAEDEAVRRFLPETPTRVWEQMVADTRHWVMRDLRNGSPPTDARVRSATTALFKRYGRSRIERWGAETWTAFTLHLLWYVCHSGVHGVRRFSQPAPPPLRHRDLLKLATGVDTDRDVNEVLIRFSAAYLDQGLAHWTLPERDRGFLAAWLGLYRRSHPVAPWLRQLPAELERIARHQPHPLQLIAESLDLLGVHRSEEDDYLAQTLLALPGWAGMIWQMETNAEWTAHPAPAGSLVEYLAVRLLLERLALAYFGRESAGYRDGLAGLRADLRRRIPREERVSVDQRAFLVFQLAQHLGWKPYDLYRLTKEEWSRLVEEIETFSAHERSRVYHLAYERRFRNQVLDALIAHASQPVPSQEAPTFQVLCCLDEREESFRRHLEEIEPNCETFGTAGFFAVAMYYRGAGDAHFVPLCPIVIKPQHYVREEAVVSFEASGRRRAETRRALGMTSHHLHTQSRSAMGGAIAAILGPLASIPLLARVLFPRSTARVRRLLGRFVLPAPVTRLTIERTEATPGPENGHLGYSLEEMVDIAQRVLGDVGLSRRLARLVVVVGHGSSSLNNPHESAHDCGACGGGRGGPNARAFTHIMSDPRVRQRLSQRGLEISPNTVFVAAYHNTCDDSMQYYDLDRLPLSHRDDFEAAQRVLAAAAVRNAHERCRRFDSAALGLSAESALIHVEERAEDLSQVRPEYGHATNAICFVGRRSRTRGLFLDRRAFLTSYDPELDDQQQTTLTRILQAVFPVCAGINLEYYFCVVDPVGYGCGTKLPHNITSLLGVMDGAASDLRTGLPWQMVEIHEPVRLLFVVETPPAALSKILQRNPSLDRLVRNDWVQLATIDPQSATVHVFSAGRFERYVPESTELPVVASSVDWYRGWRNHLGFARVEGGARAASSSNLPECHGS